MPGTREKALRSDIVYPVLIDQDITETIAATADDERDNYAANLW